MQPHKFFSVEQVIDRQPLTVSPETLLSEVIRQMQEWSNSCALNQNEQNSDTGSITVGNNSCALVVKNKALEGIFTERDLVKLIAVGTNLSGIAISQVMKRELITLRLTGAEDVFTALNLIRQHKIRHLPVIDQNNRLLGLITTKNLRRNLQPINLMKWRRVQEIMETDPIHALPNLSVRQAANLMTKHQVSYVAIVEPDKNVEGLLIPIGIITERDIVQFQNLNLDFAQPVKKFMSTPLFLVSTKDTLWKVHQEMQHHRVRRLVVGGERGELRGIVTQLSLLQIFDPTEMYGVIEELQQQVCQLEIEQSKYLQNRTTQLKEQVREHTSKLTRANQKLQQEIQKGQKTLRQRELAESKLRLQARQQRAIAELGQYALEEKNLISLMEQAANLVAAILDVEYCKVLELLPDGKNLLLKAGVGWKEELIGVATVQADTNSQAGYTLLTSEPVIVTDLLSETRFTGSDLLLDRQLASGISVIIQGRARPFGVLGAHTIKRRIFNQDEINFIQAIANIIAQANERQLVESELHQQLEFEQLLASISTHFLNLTPAKFSEGIDFALQAISELTKVDTSYIFRLSEDQTSFSMTHEWMVQGKKRQIHKAQNIPVKMFPWSIAQLQNNQTICVSNTDNLPPEAAVDRENWLTFNIRSLICIPLKFKNHVTGWIGFASFHQEKAWSEHKINLLKVVGEIFASTLQRQETEREGKQVRTDLEKSNRLLEAITWIQTQFLADSEPAILFDGMLDRLLELTDSEYGFIGEILFAADGSPMMEESYMKFRGRPYLKTHAITNIAWNEETRAFYAKNAPKGMEFHNLKTLFGAVIVTGQPVIANSPSTDPRRGGIPEGHPPLNAFLGVPFFKETEITGMVGIANREGGYNQVMVDYLQPLLATFSRIIEAYRSEREKQQAEQKIIQQAALLNVATDAIIVRGLDNQLLFWNRGAERLYGWTQAEALARNANELLYREPLKRLREIKQTVLREGEWQGELNQVNKAGKNIVVESRWTLVRNETGNPQSYLVVNTDITEQKQLESQFLRTQRLESLGTLASGIAHDLNNILAPILGFAQLLPLKLPDLDQQTQEYFRIIKNNAQRGTALVKQILTFARGLEGERGILQIRHLIRDIKKIVEETFPKSIELDINTPRNLLPVNGDINQIHQVLMNLVVNARDAMPNGGKLIIEAENYLVDQDYARLHLDATVGSYVLISVKDTGVGIPPEIIDHIFEPFFTTKEVGHGTGLGLSTLIGIVKSHGGFVDVVSNTRGEARGTQVKVFLPACNLAATELEAEAETPQGNGELILVVDDENSILEVTKATLISYNYKVLTASNGIEAIAIYAQNKNTIDLVIMDIMMPTMDGKTAILALKQINLEIKIIAVSGLISSQEIINDINGNVVAFIAKPYTNEKLLKEIYQVVSR